MHLKMFSSILIRSRAVRLFACLTIIGFVPAAAFSAPANPDDYIQAAGGFVDLPRGSYVEGSSKFGGIQPDYKIADDPDLDRFLAQVQKAVLNRRKLSSLKCFV
jgi:hypothetical protein